VAASMGLYAPVRRPRPWRSAHPFRGRGLGSDSQSVAASMGFGEGGGGAMREREASRVGRERVGEGGWNERRMWLKYV
jgi:hypothetical protein